MRARLRYVARLARTRPPTVMALLGSFRSAWADPVLADLRCLRDRVALVAALPDPADVRVAWLDAMRDAPRWSRAVRALCSLTPFWTVGVASLRCPAVTHVRTSVLIARVLSPLRRLFAPTA